MLRWLKSWVAGGHPLGPLETELLRALWRRGDGTVREFLDEAAVQAAYTTVMTTLDRLYKKGLLDRVPDGRAFRYRPRYSEEEFNRLIIAAQLDKLLRAAAQPAAPLGFLVDTVAQHDATLLDDLERAVSRKRREIHNSEKR